jgi:hypothetical protein
MDDLRPFLKPEPFYDRYGGASFQLGTLGSSSNASSRKPLICRLCLKPVRTLTLKHVANSAKCGVNQPQSVIQPGMTQATMMTPQVGGMVSSGGAAMPSIPIMNAQIPMPTPPALTGGAPGVAQATPMMSPQMLPGMMSQVPGAGGGIPCRTGLGDGSAMMGQLMAGQQLPVMPTPVPGMGEPAK